MQLINSEQLMKVNGHGREKLERKTFPAVGEAIFWSAPGFKEKTFDSSGFSVEDLISALAVILDG